MGEETLVGVKAKLEFDKEPREKDSPSEFDLTEQIIIQFVLVLDLLSEIPIRAVIRHPRISH